MEIAELIELLGRGEDSRLQYKADASNADALAAEIVAFANSGGGRILIGVGDHGVISGLDGAAVERINQLLANAASNNVRPAVNLRTENVVHPAGTVIVVLVPDGVSKPYMDKNGAVWVKNGSDKRRATAREELQRLFQAAGLVHADQTPVPGLTSADLDRPFFERFFEDNYGEPWTRQSIALPQLLENMNLARDGVLNCAGALLFARTPWYRLPAFMVKAVAFPGHAIEDEKYRDSRDIVGKLSDVFQQAMAFLLTNTPAVQGDQAVNSTAKSEVPRVVWEELVANALIHRDYFVQAPVRILVFLERVEIVSPGHLPNNLTVANIKAGNSNMRNPILASFAAKLLPYRGLGSGILRSLREWPRIDFVDDREGNLFRVIVRLR